MKVSEDVVLISIHRLSPRYRFLANRIASLFVAHAVRACRGQKWELLLDVRSKPLKPLPVTLVTTLSQQSRAAHSGASL